METAYKEFQGGNLDVCDVPVAQVDSAVADRGKSEDGYTMSDGQHMLLGEELSTYYLIVNNTIEPYNNPDFRRALSLAINREAICKTLFKGTRTPADGIVPPAIAGYEKNAWADCRYDKDAAVEILDKLYPAGNDGSRGLKLKLSYNQDGGHKEIMESVIGDLNAVGIDVESDTPEWAAFISSLDSKSYEFGRMGWSADYPIWIPSCTRCSTPRAPTTRPAMPIPRSTRLSWLLAPPSMTPSASRPCRLSTARLAMLCPSSR